MAETPVTSGCICRADRFQASAFLWLIDKVQDQTNDGGDKQTPVQRGDPAGQIKIALQNGQKGFDHSQYNG